MSDVVHMDVMDKMHRQRKSSDDALPAVAEGSAHFTQEMLAKVHTIVPMVWR